MTKFLRMVPVATGLAIGAFFLLVEPAAAAVVVDLDPPAARPGTTVVATTVDESMSTIPSGRLQLLLAPSQETANNATGPDDPTMTSIGVLNADEQCVGRLSSTVPDLPTGRYVVVAHCAECRPNMVFPDACNPQPELAENATGQ